MSEPIKNDCLDEILQAYCPELPKVAQYHPAYMTHFWEGVAQILSAIKDSDPARYSSWIQKFAINLHVHNGIDTYMAGAFLHGQVDAYRDNTRTGGTPCIPYGLTDE